MRLQSFHTQTHTHTHTHTHTQTCIPTICTGSILRNQVHAGLRPERAWFKKQGNKVEITHFPVLANLSNGWCYHIHSCLAKPYCAYAFLCQDHAILLITYICITCQASKDQKYLFPQRIMVIY